MRSLHRSAGVGFRINNPHQVVGHGSKTPLKSPLVQGGTLFSSNVAPHGGVKNSFENWLKVGATVPSGDLRSSVDVTHRRSESTSRIFIERRAAPGA